MVFLRFSFFLCFGLLSAALGAVLTGYVYDKKIVRITEERDGYKALTDKAMEMSDKSLVFAQGYQEVLALCSARLNAALVAEQTLSVGPYKKGGIGGPVGMRRKSNLP